MLTNHVDLFWVNGARIEAQEKKYHHCRLYGKLSCLGEIYCVRHRQANIVLPIVSTNITGAPRPMLAQHWDNILNVGRTLQQHWAVRLVSSQMMTWVDDCQS